MADIAHHLWRIRGIKHSNRSHISDLGKSLSINDRILGTPAGHIEAQEAVIFRSGKCSILTAGTTFVFVIHILQN